MRTAVVESQTGLVKNIIEANPAVDASPYSDCNLVAATDETQIGFVWDGTSFFDPNPPPQIEPVVIVPSSITRRQCALQLLSLAMITTVEALSMTQSGIPPASIQANFDAMSEPDRSLAMIDFAAVNYYRSNPLINTLMAENGMTSEEVDQFFIAAAAL